MSTSIGAALEAPRPSVMVRLRFSGETYIAVLSLVGILAYIVMRFVGLRPALVALVPLFVVLIFGGVPLLLGLARKVIALEFGSDLLAGISIATAVILGEYLVACIVVLMLSGGAALEQFAMRRASSILEALSRRMPNIAHRQGPSVIDDIALNDINVGDTLVVFPHELCPVDGVVMDGHGWMDESYLSGEPYQMPKVSGSHVLSGSINGDAALTIRAIRQPIDSRYARIMRVMQAAEGNRPRLRRLGDRLGAWYIPATLALASAGWIASGSAHRFLSVVVIATPCPLLIGIPIAIIGAISLAARRGIIIKNPAMLERIDTCRTVIFDKTGTLTHGKPSLTEIVCAPGFDRNDVLRLTACLEQYSKHPLAGAVLAAAQAQGLQIEPVSHISEQPGCGVRGVVGDTEVEITSRQTIARQGRTIPGELAEAEIGLESLVYIGGTYAALLRFRDEPRREGRPFVSHLSPLHRIINVILLSGDRQSEVAYMAERIGIAEMYYGKSPEEKVAIVTEQTRRAPTLFIGDGINDAPAMQAATVGLAFGQANEITTEAADAVILEPSLVKVDEALHIGRRMRVIALQSAVGGMAISAIGMLFAVAGYLPPIAGAIAQEIIDVAAVVNALRVGFPRGGLTDF